MGRWEGGDGDRVREVRSCLVLGCAFVGCSDKMSGDEAENSGT